MKRVLKKYKWEFVAVAVLMLLVYATLAISLDFKNFDITMPIAYQGGDDFGTAYKHAKVVSDSGSKWIYESDRLGAPYGAEYYDFMPDSLMNADVLFLRFFGLFSEDPVTVVNLTIVFLFFLIALISYFVMRQLGIRQDFAVVGSLLFDFMYYHFMRLVSHFCLSSYEFVPLSILLCIWLWKDDRLFAMGKDFWKYKKNYLVLLFFFFIANNGIGYYTFFTCMFLVITGISKAVKQRSGKAVFQMIRMVVSNVLFMILALVPCIVYQIQNGANLTQRSLADSELYALKIVQLLIPYKDYGIQKLQEYNQEYYQTFALTESITSYLGTMASLGFLVLIFGLMRRRENMVKQREPLALFVELNIFAVLFATMGGFGGIFANFVTSLIRGTNRISIFMAFMALSTIGILMTRLMQKKGRAWKVWKPICGALFCALAISSLYDQIPVSVTGAAAQLQEEKNSDSQFVKRIEDSVPKGSMIFQLPYHPYPEGGPVNQMQDYHLFVGFMYSKDLKWSYGGSKGREGDLWYQQTAGKPVEQMVEELRAKDFAGVYVDKRAYDDIGFADLDASLKRVVGCEPIHSKNGNLYFYKF